MKTIDKILNTIFEKTIYIIIAIVLLYLGFKIIKYVEKKVKSRNFDKIDASVKTFLISFLSIVAKSFLIIIAAYIVGIPTTSVITILGSCGLAIGLALQGGLSNIAGGVMILIFKPFKVGDYIEVNSNQGNVKSITMFYTTIVTLDNKEINLPNGNLSNNNIINYTANPEMRLDLNFNVSYDSNIDKVKKVIFEVINSCEMIDLKKKNEVRLDNHSDSSLTFIVKVWIKWKNYFETKYFLEENIKKAFDENDIEIPYPQLDIHRR